MFDGDAAYTLDLSSRRAEAVRTNLVERGVDAERLIARGYGEQNPIASNDMPQSEAAVATP